MSTYQTVSRKLVDINNLNQCPHKVARSLTTYELNTFLNTRIFNEFKAYDKLHKAVVTLVSERILLNG